MFSPLISSIALASALAFAGIAASAHTAVARTSSDGSWSVLIITDNGACDRAYRYGIQINNGHLLSGVGESVNLQGRVAHDGAIRVTVSSGNNRADGFGRLSSGQGSGLWRGKGSAGACAGRWEAERRG